MVETCVIPTVARYFTKQKIGFSVIGVTFKRNLEEELSTSLSTARVKQPQVGLSLSSIIYHIRSNINNAITSHERPTPLLTNAEGFLQASVSGYEFGNQPGIKINIKGPF